MGQGIGCVSVVKLEWILGKEEAQARKQGDSFLPNGHRQFVTPPLSVGTWNLTWDLDLAFINASVSPLNPCFPMPRQSSIDLDSADRPFDNIINFRDVGRSVNHFCGAQYVGSVP